MSEAAILFAYGMITIFVLIGYSWLARDIRHIKKQMGIALQRSAWEKKRQIKILRMVEAKSEIPFIRPKGGIPKTYNKWSRKGNCPGCNVGTGSRHRLDCIVKKNLLKQIAYANTNR